MTFLDRCAWAIVFFAACYFAGHVLVALWSGSLQRVLESVR